MSGPLRRSSIQQVVALCKIQREQILRSLYRGTTSSIPSTVNNGESSVSAHPVLTNCRFIPTRLSSTSYSTSASNSPWFKALNHSLCCDTLGSAISTSHVGTYIQRRFKGHSKWQNIQHRKKAQDKKRADLMARLSTSIRAAITAGGSPDPKANIQLANILDIAKKNNMPKVTIDNQLAKAVEMSKTHTDFKLAFSGPHGTTFLVIASEKNLGVLNGNIKKHMKRFQFIRQEFGTVEHLFDYKGELTVPKPSGDLDELAINCDCEEYFEEKSEDNKDIVKFICDGNSMMSVKKKLEEHGCEILDFETKYVPHTPLELTDEQLDEISACTDRLEELDNLLAYYVDL